MNLEYPSTIDSQSGYIFNFQGKAFDPNGLAAVDPAQDVIDSHNRDVAKRELERMRITGQGILYISNGFDIGDWIGANKWRGYNRRTSWHNMAGRDGRTDIDFTFDGSRWHGVNIGDNQILRVKRCKN